MEKEPFPLLRPGTNTNTSTSTSTNTNSNNNDNKDTNAHPEASSLAKPRVVVAVAYYV